VKYTVENRFLDAKGKELKKLERKSDVTVSTTIANHVRDTREFTVSVELVDKHGRVKHSSEEAYEVTGESEEVFNVDVAIPANHTGQRYTLTVVVKDAEGTVVERSEIQ
jgi:hypothetical protein